MASEHAAAPSVGNNDLITFSHTYAAALAAKNYTDGKIAVLAEAVSDALMEQNEVKADKPSAFTASLPAALWNAGSTVPTYPYYCDLSCSGVTENDLAEVILSPASQTSAAACGMCPTVETLENKIRFYAKSAAAENIIMEIRIWKGADE